jgi:hypothetical protein
MYYPQEYSNMLIPNLPNDSSSHVIINMESLITMNTLIQNLIRREEVLSQQL